MKVIVLAAGQGKRLSTVEKSLPKLFVEVGGRTIFEYQLDALSNLVDTGSVDPSVTVVLGYGFAGSDRKEERIDKYVRVDPRFDYDVVLLPNWKQVENSASALAGVESLESGDHVLLLCGDIITTSTQLRHVVRSFEERCDDSGYSAVTAIEGIQDEMTAVLWDEDRRITDYGAITGHQEAGIFILHRDHLDRACSIWEANMDSEWFPIVFPEVPSKAICIDDNQQLEINTCEHFEEARGRLPFDDAE